MRKLLFVFAVAALAIASAKTYNIKLYQNAFIGGQEFKAGDYRIDVQDNKAVIKGGASRAEVPVKVESSGTRYGSTTVRMANADGKMKIQEIRIGGSNTKLVFTE